MGKLTIKPFGIFWQNFADNLMLKRSSPRNCKMVFIIGRGFAERQILKKWKWPYLLNWVEYFDKLLRKHWYSQDLAQEIANWHFSSVEALPSSKFWKSENGPISRLWRILWWNFAYILILTRCGRWDCQMIFGIGRGLPRFKFWKKVKLALPLEPFGIFWQNWAYPLLLIWSRQRDCQI